MFTRVDEITRTAIRRFNARHEPCQFVDALGDVHELRTDGVLYVARRRGQQVGKTFHTLRALRSHLETPA